MKRNLISLTFGLLLTVSAFGQSQVIDILKGGVADANYLANEYLRPYGEMLGVNLNAGWYNSAKVHKVGGFDITLLGSYTTPPSSKESFTIDPSRLQQLESLDGTKAPTISGSEKTSVRFGYKDDPTSSVIATLKGAGANYFASPMIQGAVGLPFHTEVMGRFMPRVEYGDYGKAYMWGLGVKHSLKDYIPFVKRIPFLQLSVLGAYTHFESSLAVSSQDIGEGNLEVGSNAYTGRLLLGANFPVVSFYTGAGFGNTKSNFDVKGDFSVGPDEEPNTHPIALAYSTGNFDFNAGMRIRLAIFSLHADYTIGEYSVITAGVGINFR